MSQTAIEGGGARLIGGSTFVKGVVAGFPVEPPDAGGSKPRSFLRWPMWLLLALILLLVAIWLLA